jgi:hypothetical protein
MTCPSIPAARYRSRSLAITFAVSATIGTRPAGGGSARMRRVASTPSITGICTSISTRSNPPRDASSTASAPSSANTTSCPCRPSMSPSRSRLSSMSSASSSRSGRTEAGSKPARPDATAASPTSSATSNQNRLPTPGALSTPISPAHGLDQPLADRQPEPAAAVAARGRAVRLGEGPEQPRRLPGRHPDPGVAHLEPQPHPPLALRAARDRDRDPAFVGELERVADQVEQHLPEPGRVAHADRRRVLVELEPQLEPALAGRRRQQRAHLVQEAGDREVDPLELEPAGLEAGEVEDVVDDREQVPARGADRGRRSPSACRSAPPRRAGRPCRARRSAAS